MAKDKQSGKAAPGGDKAGSAHETAADAAGGQHHAADGPRPAGPDRQEPAEATATS